MGDVNAKSNGIGTDTEVPKNAMTTNLLLVAILVLFLLVGADEARRALMRIMG